MTAETMQTTWTTNQIEMYVKTMKALARDPQWNWEASILFLEQIDQFIAQLPAQQRKIAKTILKHN